MNVSSIFLSLFIIVFELGKASRHVVNDPTEKATCQRTDVCSQQTPWPRPQPIMWVSLEVDPFQAKPWNDLETQLSYTQVCDS